jgi:hypothetical protein
MGNEWNILTVKPEGNRPLRRTGRRWQGNIRKYVRETEWEDMDQIELADDKDQWRVGVAR